MLATSKNVLFLGHDHVLTIGTDDPSLAGARAIIKVSGHQYWWLEGGYDLEVGLFRSGRHGGYLVYSGFFAQCMGFGDSFMQSSCDQHKQYLDVRLYLLAL